MNIEEIEKNLNNYEGDPNVVIKEILNMSIKNQATLESVLILQKEILFSLDKSVNKERLHKDISDGIEKRVAEISALIASRLI